MDEQNKTAAQPKKKKLIKIIFVSAIVLLGLFLLQQNLSKTNHLRALRFQMVEMKNNQVAQERNQQAIQLAVAELQSQQNRLSTSQNWNIASYLIRLANIQVSVLHDPDQAQQLLVSAVATLATDESPRAQTLKNAIGDDLATLNQTATAETELTLGQINSLNNQIAALTAASPKSFHVQMPLPDMVAGNWWQHVKFDLADLKSLVQIRYNDKPIRPLLSDEQMSLLKAATRAQLSLAQWALVTRQASAYQMALNNASAWLAQYDQENDQAQLISKQLSELAQKPVITQINGLQSWRVWQDLKSKN